MDFVGLLGARGVKLVVGLATMFVYARMFGVSATYDAWVWSLGIINAAGLILFGPITETIRASYTSIDHQEGRPAAEQYLATISVMMIGTAAVAAIITTIGIPILTRILVDQHTERTDATTFFLHILAPSLALSQIVAVLTAHLNCHGKVYPPEIAGIVGGAIGTTFIIAFPSLPATWLLAGSYYIGLAAPLLIGASFWSELFRSLRRLEKAAFDRHMREAMAFSLPLLLPYGLGQIGGLIERQFALQAGTGVLAVLSYAFFARNTVQAVFTAALSALAVPALARAWNPSDPTLFSAATRHWSHQSLLIVTMGMIALFGISDLAPVILFGAKIGPASQSLLGELLRYYCVAILAVVLYLIGGAMLLAARKGKTYALLGSSASIASAVLLIVLFPFIGIVAIPVSLGISHSAAAFCMLYSLNRADADWVFRWAGACVVVVLGGGWFIRVIDISAHATMFSVAIRLILCLAATGIMCSLLWIFDHRRSSSVSASKIEA